MKKFLQRLQKNEKGFTLIELVIVIAILAVISAIAVPNILNSVDNARRTTDVANAQMIANAAAMVKARNENLSYAIVANQPAVYTINNTGITANDNAVADFATALETELNGGEIVPRYRSGAAAGASAFIMTIETNGVISIVVDVTEDPNLPIFPTPHATYTNN